MIKHSNTLRIWPLLVAFCLLFTSCTSIKPLEVKSINQFKIVETSKKEIVFGINASIHNPNAFKIKVKDFDLKLKINNINLGKATIDKKIKIKRKSTNDYYFEVRVKLGNMILGMLPLIASLKKDKTAKIHLEGNVKASAFGISKRVDIGIERDITLRN